MSMSEYYIRIGDTYLLKTGNNIYISYDGINWTFLMYKMDFSFA